jgi:hypothetical protein
LHALILLETQVPLATIWLNYLHVISTLVQTSGLRCHIPAGPRTTSFAV